MPSNTGQPRRRWDDTQRLPPWVIQALGSVLVVACFVFYFFTGQASPLLLTSALGLVTYGSVKAVAERVVRQRTISGAVTDGRRHDDAGSDE